MERSVNYVAEDHPRIRGEKIIPRLLAASLLGSPPHTRGKVIPPSVRRATPRITPAYAGKRPAIRDSAATFWDHPRIRGEKWLPADGANDHEGSPPHTRGKDLANGIFSSCIRITPAYAGKSGCCGLCFRPDRDHPRIRGEKLFQVVCTTCTLGSPPHTRGKG